MYGDLLGQFVGGYWGSIGYKKAWIRGIRSRLRVDSRYLHMESARSNFHFVKFNNSEGHIIYHFVLKIQIGLSIWLRYQGLILRLSGEGERGI